MRHEKFGTLYHREYYKKRKQAIFEYLGSQCVVCGTTEDLQIDHIDRNDKAFSINKKMSVKNNKKELDKCQVLCKECHLKKTTIENSGLTHGTVYAWQKKKCRCSICCVKQQEYYIRRNKKRREATARVRK